MLKERNKMDWPKENEMWTITNVNNPVKILRVCSHHIEIEQHNQRKSIHKKRLIKRIENGNP